MTEERTIEPEAALAVPAKKKLPWSRIFRPVVSIGLLYLLLRGTNVTEFLGLARKANFLFLGIGLVLVLLALAVSAYKWQRLLAVQNVEVPLPRLFISYLVGLFFNNFLPTNIGGDVVRMADVSKYTGKTSESVASVVGERLLAAFALALTAALGFVLSLVLRYKMDSISGWLVAGVLVVTLAVILLFGVERWRKALGKKIRLPDKFSLSRRLGGLGASLGACLRDRGNVAWVIALSMVFHFTVVLITYFIFLSLGVSVPFVYCLLFIPIISAIQMLPISVSGFGVREGAYVFFFGSVGLTSTQAIASSLIFWALVALVSLAGGVIFALRK